MVQIHDNDEVHVFLQRHFLRWLEALSLINRVAEVIGHMSVLQSRVSVGEPPYGTSREGIGSNM
jgi:hypothetical protein